MKNKDVVPKDFAHQIITIFTTMKVGQFNDLFIKLCNSTIALELQLQASIDSTMVYGINIGAETQEYY